MTIRQAFSRRGFNSGFNNARFSTAESRISRLMVNNIISGEQLTRMEKLSMCFSRNDVTVQQQSGSLKGY
jgi:hypothetical protein